MSNNKILIVDDDKNIAELISLYLQKEGFETMEVYNGREAVDVFPAYAPFLVLLDIMLPGINGYEVCKELHKISRVPIIMLTAKGDTLDKVQGLELGADDYIVKPFDPQELVARVKAVIRRYEKNEQRSNQDQVVDLQNLHINPAKHIVIYHGQELELPPKEYDLLFILASNPGLPMNRDDLLTACWGYDYPGDTRTVDVHIMRIREKLNKEDPWSIKTVWGIGYKLEANQ